MTMYLCKMDPNVTDEKGDPKFVAVIGRIVEYGDGYVFISNTAAHGRSRKAWPSVNAAIPRWAHKMGYTRLYDGRELPCAGWSAVAQ